jgi:hypothetical protein
MNGDNLLWGAPRIHGELLNLSVDIGETSVSKYTVRHRNAPNVPKTDLRLASARSGVMRPCSEAE